MSGKLSNSGWSDAGTCVSSELAELIAAAEPPKLAADPADAVASGPFDAQPIAATSATIAATPLATLETPANLLRVKCAFMSHH